MLIGKLLMNEALLVGDAIMAKLESAHCVGDITISNLRLSERDSTFLMSC